MKVTKSHTNYLKRAVAYHRKTQVNKRIKGLPIDYTVIGFYDADEQPWMTHVKAGKPTEAAEKGARKISKSSSVGLNQVYIVEVIKGKVKGCLGNNEIYSLWDHR
jgi:hypothetical protein